MVCIRYSSDCSAEEMAGTKSYMIERGGRVKNLIDFKCIYLFKFISLLLEVTSMDSKLEDSEVNNTLLYFK